MTDLQQSEIRELQARGYSNLFISACVDGVSYREIEDLLGPMPHTEDRFPPKLREWWNQQPWVWRLDNTQPTEAPWERVSREWF
jgi:hypothetical protein